MKKTQSLTFKLALLIVTFPLLVGLIMSFLSVRSLRITADEVVDHTLRMKLAGDIQVMRNIVIFRSQGRDRLKISGISNPEWFEEFDQDTHRQSDKTVQYQS